MPQVAVNEESLTNIANAIRSKKGSTDRYTPGQMASAINGIRTADEVTLVQKNITENGTYNPESDSADGYSAVTVSVENTFSSADNGKVVSGGALVPQTSMSVVSNGTYDTTVKNEVVVAVPSAMLISKYISQNGTYDPTDDNADAFSSVVVNVSGGGSGSGIPELIITGGSGALSIQTSTLRPYAMYSHSGITDVTINGVSVIASHAFESCNNLTKLTATLCTKVSERAFFACSKLSDISLPMCNEIDGYAFYSTSVKEVILPRCVTLSSSAFIYCRSLLNVDLPMCETIKGDCFMSCANLSTVSLPKVQLISDRAFRQCSALKEVYLPSASLSGAVFGECRGLESFIAPLCETIPGNCFTNCIQLHNVEINNCKIIQNYAFQGCYGLSSITLEKCSSIGVNAFWLCSGLLSLYLLYDSVVTIQSNTFNNTPILLSSYKGVFGSVYVPASLVESYKSAQWWSAISDRITSYLGE